MSEPFSEKLALILKALSMSRARLALAGAESLAPEGSIPGALLRHLTRDIGPAQLAAGGGWLLRAHRSRSLSAGAADI